MLKAERASEPGVKQACLSVFLGCCTEPFQCVMQAKVEESTKSPSKEVGQVKKGRVCQGSLHSSHLEFCFVVVCYNSSRSLR